MSKSLCKTGEKKKEKDGKKLKYVCKKCDRKAFKEKHLCKPAKL